MDKVQMCEGKQDMQGGRTTCASCRREEICLPSQLLKGLDALLQSGWVRVCGLNISSVMCENDCKENKPDG